MKYKDLKRYILVSTGSVIDQNYNPISKSDVIEKDNDLYIKSQDTVLDGNAFVYETLLYVICSYAKEKTIYEKRKEYEKYSKAVFNQVALSLAYINAYSEYHIEKEIKIIKDNGDKSHIGSSKACDYYYGMHNACDEIKRNLRCNTFFRDCNIHYFGEGGSHAYEKEWYDSPFHINKNRFMW